MKYSTSVALVATSLLLSPSMAQVVVENKPLDRRTFPFAHPGFGGGAYGGVGGYSGGSPPSYGGGGEQGGAYGGGSYGGGSYGGSSGSEDKHHGHHGSEKGSESSSSSTAIVQAQADQVSTAAVVQASQVVDSSSIIAASSTLVDTGSLSTTAIDSTVTSSVVVDSNAASSIVVDSSTSTISVALAPFATSTEAPVIVSSVENASPVVVSQAAIQTQSSSTGSTGVAYGSGSSSSSSTSDAVNACIQVCQATNGQSGIVSSSNSNTAGSTSIGSSGSSSTVTTSTTGSTTGSGTTTVSGTTTSSDGSLIAGPGQVIVAPKKGDLRMVPFAIEAATGSVVEFIWGAGPHTVTQSSSLEPCNATLGPSFTSSGKQDKGFSYPVTVVDASKPTYYFCSVATHCVKGMYGIVNPTIAKSVSASFGAYMDTMASTNPAFAQMMNETSTMCQGNSRAANWGSTFAVSQLPDWAMESSMWNVMATRQYYAMNPSSLLALSTTNSSSSSSSPSTGSYTSATIVGASTAQATLASSATRQAIVGTAVLMGLGLAMMI